MTPSRQNAHQQGRVTHRDRDSWPKVVTTLKLGIASLPVPRRGVEKGEVLGKRSREMQRVILAFMVCLTLAACGLGETAVSAAVGGASEAEQAKEALKTEARVKQQLDAAAALDAQHRQAAEADTR
jgi:hypothetical protein